jgi:hypothetical protein
MQGDATEIEKLASGFEKLNSTKVGRPIADAIQERGTTIKFGDTEGAIAQFDLAANEITIHENLKDASPAVLAAHLAHEGTHAGWDKPYRTDSLADFADDYIDEEYHAHRAQAEVWDDLTGEKRDQQCDAVNALIAMGEDDAKSDIRARYGSEIVKAWHRITGT